VLHRTVDDLRDTHSDKRFLLHVATPRGPIEPVLSMLGKINAISELQVVENGNGNDDVCLSFMTTTPAEVNPRVLAVLLEMGLKPYSLTASRPSLEEIYLNIDRRLGSTFRRAQG